VTSLKLFFQLPYKILGWRAELELIKRFEIVCRRLGYESFASPSIADAKGLDADFIFALHFESAKVTPDYSVALVWNPVSFLQQAGPHAFAKTLSHDVHLYGAESIRTYFSSLQAQGYRTRDAGDFYPSAQKTIFLPPESFGNPVYIGVLWQQDRHRDFFSILDGRNSIHGYGPIHGWSRFKNIYRGSFAIDGNSYQSVYRSSGIGLCVHSENHRAEGVPSMRIFEIVASGCVAICDEHPFIRKTFGDTVHYLDEQKSPHEMAAQLEDIVEKIQNSPARAREMAAAANQIFNDRLCLDHLLTEALQKLIRYKARRFETPLSLSKPSVQVFTRTAGARPTLLRRALQSIVNQSYKSVHSTLIYHGPDLKGFVTEELPLLRHEFPGLNLSYLHLPLVQALSFSVPLAFEKSDADYVGFLDDDDWYHPEHLQTLLDCLDENPGAAIALSGAALDWEWILNPSSVVPISSYAQDSSELLSFEPFSPEKFRRGEMNICSAMLLIRRTMLTDWKDWPSLDIAEDRALLAFVTKNETDRCAFTSRVSCTWTYRHLQNENRIDMTSETEALRFPSDLVYKGLNLPYLESPDRRLRCYHSNSLMQKCSAAIKAIRKHRWVPRQVRPLIYQTTLNALLVGISGELIGLRALHGFNAMNVREMQRLVGRPVAFPWSKRQQQFNQLIAGMLPATSVVIDLSYSQHTFNLTVTREVDRLARAF
jgi:hypothetical protein